jgi:hypothetical protein
VNAEGEDASPSQAIRRLEERTLDPRAASLRSSLWRRDEEGWRMVFHQGTPVPG